MLKITSLGGSGEDSRNCFLVTWNDHSILLDCGVRREIAPVSRVYPLLTAEIADSLEAVFLSHAHEDHTAALPYLYHLGYMGKVYASAETIMATPGFMKKWHNYAIANKADIPFEENDIDKVCFSDISEAPEYLKSCGRSGHMLGSRWYLFEIEDKRILYTGDITFDSLLLEADELPKCDIMIIDSAYASRHIIQKESYERLAHLARKTLEKGGNLLLPVPANGRGIDMYLYLEKLGLNMLVDKAVIRNTEKLKGQKEWIRETDLWNETSDTTAVIEDDLIKPDAPTVIIVPDGMMTTPVSEYYYDLLKKDPNSLTVITGHSAAGTLASNIQKPEYRKENGIVMGVDNVTVKVHPDEEDVLEMVRKSGPEKVLLFHSRSENCTRLIKQLSEITGEVVCEINAPIIVK